MQFATIIPVGYSRKYFSSTGYFITSVIFVVSMLLAPNRILAQTVIAQDEASNYASWTDGSNEGFGFEPWTITSGTTDGGFAGAFTGNPADAGISGMPNPSFGLFANPEGGNFVNTDRPFAQPMLAGQTLSFDWGVNFDSDGPGNKGIILFSGGTGGDELIVINQGGTAEITINGDPMFSNYGTQAMTLNFEVSAPNELRVFGTGRDGSESFDETFTISGPPDALRFYASGLASGDERQPYFNNFQITAVTPQLNADELQITPGRTRMLLDWENGDGDRRIVVARAGSEVNELPENGTAYSADTSFGEGDEIGDGNFVVYDGTGESVMVTDLSAGVYHFAVFEYNDAADPQYQTWESAGNTIPRESAETVTFYRTISGGDWTSPETWLDNEVPPADQNIVVEHNVEMNTDVNSGQLTIRNNSNLSFENSTRILQIAAGRQLIVEGGSELIVNEGTVGFSGNSAVTGNVEFHNLNIAGDVDFLSASTVSGILRMLPFAQISGNPLQYLPGSELHYETGGSYTAAQEWQTGAGNAPFSVRIINSVVSFGGSGSLRVIRGDLFSESAGSLQLSSESGGDLEVQGDITFNGSFDPNNRALFLRGDEDQSLVYGNGSFPLSDLLIDKSGGTVTLDTDAEITSRLRIDGGTVDIQDVSITGEPDLIFRSGHLLTGGQNLIFSQLILEDDDATLDLGSTSHELNFTNSRDATWAGSGILTIENWSGTPGNPGTTGRLFFEDPAAILETSQPLSAAQRQRVQFNGQSSSFLDPDGGRLELVPLATAVPDAHAENLRLTVDDVTGTFLIDLSWDNGDGQERILVARADDPVNAIPADGRVYGADDGADRLFGFNIAESEIGDSGHFVVFDSRYSDHDLTDGVTQAVVRNLPGNTNLHFAVFEYNGEGSERNYKVDAGFAAADFTTLNTYMTVADGNWSDESVWEESIVPVSPVNVTIAHNVEVDTDDAIASGLDLETGNTLSFTSNGILTLQNGTFTVDGSLDAEPGRIVFTDDVTVSGTAAFFNVDVRSGAGDFGMSSSILENGALRILPGGFITDNAPEYAAGSSLIYNTDGSYNAGLEWPLAEADAPFNVIITNSNLTFQAEAAERFVNGDFTIESEGSLQLSTNEDASLTINGNWQNDGVLINEDRTVRFSGDADQEIAASAAVTEFSVIEVSKSSGTLSINGDFSADEIILTEGIFSPGPGTISERPALTFSGGIFESNGVSATFGELTLNEASTLSLNSGAHEIRFANSRNATWTDTPGEILTVEGWLGDFGLSGTGGRVLFDAPSGAGTLSAGQALTPEQRRQITFSDPGSSTGSFEAAFIEDGDDNELVPINETSPTEHATDFEAVDDTEGVFSVDLRWRNGDGTNRIIVASAGGPVDALPADGKVYGAEIGGSQIFGFDVSASEIGDTQNYVVYDTFFDTPDSEADDFFRAEITRIAGNEEIHFAIFEYTGEGANRNYLTDESGTDPGEVIPRTQVTTLGEYITVADGNWDDPAVWAEGTVPVTPVEVTIAHDVIVNTGTATLSEIIIQPGRTLSFAEGGNLSISIGDITLEEDDGEAGSINACPDGTCFGKMTFFNGAIISGPGEVILNDVDILGELVDGDPQGGVDFGEDTTINGSLTLFQNTFIVNNSNPPRYGEGSTLIYNTGLNFSANEEWIIVENDPPTEDDISRSPWNVRIIDTELTLFFNDNPGNEDDPRNREGDRFIRGDLTVEEEGEISLHPIRLNDLHIAGDVIVDGSLTTNRRALFFNGTDPQTLTVSDPLDAPFFFIDNPAGLTLNGDLVITGDDIPGELNIAENAPFTLNGSLTFVDEAVINLNDGNTGFTISDGNEFRADLSGSFTLGFPNEITFEEGATLAVSGGTLDLGRVIFEQGHLLDIEDGTLEIDEAVTERQFDGNSGWRIFAPPVSGLSDSDILSNMWVQGVPGGQASTGSPNAFRWNSTSSQWVPLQNLDSDADEPVLVFMFNDVQLPAAFRNQGLGLPFINVPTDGDERGSVTILDEVTTRFHFVGNPFATPLNWREADRTNVFDTIYMWDPMFDNGPNQQPGAWRYTNPLVSDIIEILDDIFALFPGFDREDYDFSIAAGPEIAPYQGFLVEVDLDTGPGSLSFPLSSRINEAPFYGGAVSPDGDEPPKPIVNKNPARDPGDLIPEGDFGVIGFQLQHAGSNRSSIAFVGFTEDARTGMDELDIRFRTPFNNQYVALFTRTENNQPLTLNHYPFIDVDEIEEPVEIPLDYVATSAYTGVFTLNWPVFYQIPDEWDVHLIDHTEDRKINMRSRFTYSFNIDGTGFPVPDEPESRDEILEQATEHLLSSDTELMNTSPRFTIRISKAPTRLTNQIYGPNNGWRMLASPVDAVRYGDLLEGIETRGFPGADVPDGVPNVFWYDESTQKWASPSDINEFAGTGSLQQTANAGLPLMVNINRSETPPGVRPWPVLMNVSGFLNEDDVTRTLTYNAEGGNLRGWNFVGNPYEKALDWEKIYSGQGDNAAYINDAVYVWDANMGAYGGYRFWNSTVKPEDIQLPDRIGSVLNSIEPFSGFWVRVNDETELTISRDHFTASERPAPSADRRQISESGLNLQAEAELPMVSLALTSPTVESTMGLVWTGEDNGQADIIQLQSISEIYAQILLIPDSDPLAVKSISGDVTESADFKIYLPATLNEDAELRLLTKRGLPEDFVVEITDLYTGARMPLEADQPISVEIFQNRAIAPGSLSAPRPVSIEGLEPRFELHILPESQTSAEDEADLPREVALGQNYPNPFNPATLITFDLPETAEVRLDVFNVQGQRVAQLENGTRSAGSHTVTFDAGNLASGVYIYRLRVSGDHRGEKILTRKMMLIK